MPAKRTIDPVDLLQWEGDGLNTEEMRQRLAEDGKPVSIELVRLRLREAHQASAGGPPKPKAERKASATARRLQQVASSVDVLEELRDDLQNLLDSWGESFAGTDRYQRFWTRWLSSRKRSPVWETWTYLGTAARPGDLGSPITNESTTWKVITKRTNRKR